MSDPLLSINNLSIERGERLLFDSFSLSLASGEIVQLAGQNGAGKTTLMRALAGLLDYHGGEFVWKGQDVPYPGLFSDEILYIGHKPAIRYQLTALENLRWYADIHSQQVGKVNDQKLIEALEFLGLSGYENEFCSQMSAGQKRRVGLARLSFSQAPLWILDEPFTAVDVRGVKILCEWMEKFASEGGTVLYTTHQTVGFSQCHARVIDLDAQRPSVELID